MAYQSIDVRKLTPTALAIAVCGVRDPTIRELAFDKPLPVRVTIAREISSERAPDSRIQ